jgi:PAS domain S-box-containing protein
VEETVSAQALRESEELHRITLLSMSDAVFITDDDGGFTYICPNVHVIFGHSQEEVRSMARISRLFGRDLIDAAELPQRGEVQNIELQIETKDGLSRSLLVHVKAVSIKGGTILYVCRDITERKESERALSRNEQRLTLALEAAAAGTWDWDVVSGGITWSPEARHMFGDDSNSLPPSFEAFLSRVHPFDRDRVAHTMANAMREGEPYETEFRVQGRDTGERWVMAKGKGLKNGKPLRMLGVFVDFTDRHRVEHELHELSGRLIDAHEQERSRLARELHDDVGQRLALLTVEFGVLRKRLGSADEHTADALARITGEMATIGLQLHRFSHELHPARLEQLGFEASIRSMCQEISEARGIAIQFTSSTLPEALPADVALCLYRVTQEALHNAVKHSGSSRASVTVTADANAVTLRVVDQGVGFNPAVSHRKDALGLVSMRERARLVRGSFALVAQPGAGTSVEVCVPLHMPQE